MSGIYNYKLRENFYEGAQSARDNFDNQEKAWQEEKNKIEYDLKYAMGNQIFDVCRRLAIQERNYLISEYDYMMWFMDSMKFYHQELTSLEFTNKQQEIADDLISDIEQSFSHYEEGMEIYKSILTAFNQSYSNFLAYRIRGEKLEIACATLMAEIMKLESIASTVSIGQANNRKVIEKVLSNASTICVYAGSINVRNLIDKMLEEHLKNNGEEPKV